MHPNGKFYEGNTAPGIWLEVSVCGKLFSLRGSRSAQLKGDMVCDFIINIWQYKFINDFNCFLG